MKRELILLAVIAVLMTALTAPLTGGLTALAETTPTTTMPLTTTTTGWDCISTTPPPLTTTSTTWVLTGPDGINPDYTTTVTTTTAPALCGDTKDLLSDAAITVSDTMAILGHPSGGNWLSVDCYSYDGGTISIVPPRRNHEINGLHPYLHTTIIANVPFKLTMREELGMHNAVDWVGEANVNEDGTIKAGAYVLSAKVDSMFDYCNYAHEVTVTLTAPGSVTVGHLALSNEEVCGESAPRIQTTTRPSFPWDDTTTVTTTTAPALCGDTKDLLSDAVITVSDTMAILGHPSGGNWLSVDCYSYDGGTIEIVPTGDSTINGLHPYLHTTIIANVPFKLTMTEAMGIHNAVDWVGEANVNEDGTIKAGAYVLAAEVNSMFEYGNFVDKVTVTLTAPGSVTVGHLALSDEEVCGESAPRIQTTTRPSFPSDDTTAPPTTTTNPTVGDVLLPGDADGDGLLTSSDARVILMHCLLGTGLGENGAILADYNGDGAVTTYDTRMILISLLA